jgi:hypothetical protein
MTQSQQPHPHAPSQSLGSTLRDRQGRQKTPLIDQTRFVATVAGFAQALQRGLSGRA